MKTKTFLLIISLILFGFLKCSTWPSCCLLSPPKIHLTGDKTEIENQIIGEYKEIEPEAWSKSSLQNTISKKGKTTTNLFNDQELLKAFQIREFHQPKIRTYKDKGALGENNQGLLELRPLPKNKKNQTEREILKKIIENENQARLTIFKRTLLKINTKKINNFAKKFAAEQRKKAHKNDWIQKENGAWIKK